MKKDDAERLLADINAKTDLEPYLVEPIAADGPYAVHARTKNRSREFVVRSWKDVEPYEIDQEKPPPAGQMELF